MFRHFNLTKCHSGDVYYPDFMNGHPAYFNVTFWNHYNQPVLKFWTVADAASLVKDNHHICSILSSNVKLKQFLSKVWMW
jgi:hypothetical protein